MLFKIIIWFFCYSLFLNYISVFPVTQPFFVFWLYKAKLSLYVALVWLNVSLSITYIEHSEERPVLGFSTRRVFSFIGFCSPLTTLLSNFSFVVFFCSLLLSITFNSVVSANSSSCTGSFFGLEKLEFFSLERVGVKDLEYTGGREWSRLSWSNILLPGDESLFTLILVFRLVFFLLRIAVLPKTSFPCKVFLSSPRTSNSKSALWWNFPASVNVFVLFNFGRKNGGRFVLLSLMFRELFLLKAWTSWNNTLRWLNLAIVHIVQKNATLLWLEIYSTALLGNRYISFLAYKSLVINRDSVTKLVILIRGSKSSPFFQPYRNILVKLASMFFSSAIEQLQLQWIRETRNNYDCPKCRRIPRSIITGD